MTWRSARPAVLGRDPELEHIDRAISVGRGVLLVGEAGIGKTTILDRVAESHPGPLCRITASSSSRELPLGAFLGVGDTEWSARTTPGIAAGLRSRLLGDGTRLLAIDDAHLLDPASAGLVLEIARSGVPIVAAARSSKPLPAAIDALVRDGAVDRIDVRELGAEHVGAIATEVLGGSVGSGLAVSLSDRCGGHPLHVREAARRLRTMGAIVAQGGEWRLVTSMPPLDRVPDLVQERIDALPAPVRAVLDSVAVADGIQIDALLRIHDPVQVTAAETAGVLRIVGDRVLPGHPLHRDAALARLPETARRRILADLISMGPDSVRSDAEDARRTEWRLTAGLRPSAGDLISAAETVFNTAPELCRRLVDAAIAVAGPGDELRLAGLLINLCAPDRAEEVLATVDPDSLPVEQARGLIALRAFGLAMMRDRPGAARELVDDATARYGADPDLECQRIAAIWRLGAWQEAESSGLELRDDATASLPARAAAGATVDGIRVVRIAREPFEDGARAVLSLLGASERSLAEGRGTLDVTESGRRAVYEHDLEWSSVHLGRRFRDALGRGALGEAGQYGWMIGWDELLQGRAVSGARLVLEWVDQISPWSGIVGGLMVPRVIRVLIAAGRLSEARARLDAAIAHDYPPLFQVEIELARASLLAADGDPSAAGVAIGGLEAGIRVGSELPAVDAAFLAVLLDHPEAGDRLRELLAHPETELQRIQLAVATALGEHDAVGALAAAAALGRLGYRWWAIETLHATARLRLTSGQHARLGMLLRAIEARCEPLTTLVPAPIRHLGAELTERESAVARLAAAGITDREIATRLTVSVRTVESHLAHAYTKLGVHARAELTELFRT